MLANENQVIHPSSPHRLHLHHFEIRSFRTGSLGLPHPTWAHLLGPIIMLSSELVNLGGGLTQDTAHPAPAQEFRAHRPHCTVVFVGEQAGKLRQSRASSSHRIDLLSCVWVTRLV